MIICLKCIDVLVQHCSISIVWHGNVLYDYYKAILCIEIIIVLCQVKIVAFGLLSSFLEGIKRYELVEELKS